MTSLLDEELERWIDKATANATQARHQRRGLVYDRGWPFRLDVPVEYQDWIIVAVCVIIVCIWLLPCICGKMHSPCSRRFTSCIYTRLHVFYWGVLYLTLFLVMVTIGVLPDWTVEDFTKYLGFFLAWVLENVASTIQSLAVIGGCVVMLKFRDRLVYLAGMEHITVFRFSLSQLLGFGGKKRPVELFIWKVEGLQSASAKLLKANDVFIECHLGYNEPMTTRVHNNAGSECVMEAALQFNIDESAPSSIMTILVKDQKMMASSELARLMLSTRELLGVEEQTGKRRRHFEYSQEFFVPLSLSPSGTIWLAMAPVEDWDDNEKAPLLQDDNVFLCC